MLKIYIANLGKYNEGELVGNLKQNKVLFIFVSRNACSLQASAVG